MSRKSFLNILENTFQPSVNQTLKEDLLGAVPKVIVLGATAALELDFTKNRFQVLTVGSVGLTLTAKVVNGKNSLKVGEKVFIKLIQYSTAQTVAFSTNILTDVTVSSGNNEIDLLVGIFDGTNILLGALAKAVA